MKNDTTTIAKQEKKNTILFITTGLNTGGAEIMLYNLIAAIDKTKYSPAVISLIPIGEVGKKLISLGAEVYSLNVPSGKLPTVPALLKLIRLARKIKPSVIHGWMYHGNIAAQFVNGFLQRRTPVLWTIHHSLDSLGNEKKSTVRVIALGARLSQKPSSIIYVSSTGKKQHELLGYADKKSLVIPNAVDTDLFSPSTENRIMTRKELGLPDDIFLVGHIARYHPMKDHENFLQAVALIQNLHTSIAFVLAGTNVDHQNEDLKKKILELNIQNIKLLGERNDINKILPALDVLVVSSSHGEAFPVIILEAMSSGVLCVSTDVGDASKIIGENGKVVPTKNPEALAEAISEIIDLDAVQRKKMQENARREIIANYSLRHIANEYEKLYDCYLSQ